MPVSRVLNLVKSKLNVIKMMFLMALTGVLYRHGSVADAVKQYASLQNSGK
jgi:hypothetical protein